MTFDTKKSDDDGVEIIGLIDMAVKARRALVEMTATSEVAKVVKIATTTDSGHEFSWHVQSSREQQPLHGVDELRERGRQVTQVPCRGSVVPVDHRRIWRVVLVC